MSSSHSIIVSNNTWQLLPTKAVLLLTMLLWLLLMLLGFRLAPLLPLPPAGNKAFELQEQMWSCLGQQLVQLSTIGF